MLAPKEKASKLFSPNFWLVFSFFLLVISFALLVLALNAYFKDCSCLGVKSEAAAELAEADIKAADNLEVLKDAETRHWQQALERANRWADDAQMVFFSIGLKPEEDKIPYVLYKFYSKEKDTAWEISWNQKGRMETNEAEAISKVEFISFPPEIAAQKAAEMALEDLRVKGIGKRISRLVVATKPDFDYWVVVFTVQETPRREKEYEYYVFYQGMVEAQFNEQ